MGKRANLNFLKRHSEDYKNQSWKNYTKEELQQWVYLLVKRAGHRENVDKALKDLYDAGNYLEMLKEKTDSERIGFQANE